MPRKRIERGHIDIRWPDGHRIRFDFDERREGTTPEGMVQNAAMCDAASAAMFAHYEARKAGAASPSPEPK